MGPSVHARSGEDCADAGVQRTVRSSARQTGARADHCDGVRRRRQWRLDFRCRRDERRPLENVCYSGCWPMTARTLIVAMGLTVSWLPKQQPTPPQPIPDEHPRGYVAYTRSHALTIDGRLDDEAWRDAPWSERFVDIEGARKPAPALSTRVKMLWDEQFFYVAAELIEPHLWATLTAHDWVIFHDNDFEVFIDPNGDNHEYYEFEINALGTGWDLFLPPPHKDGAHDLNSWETPV